jgi:acetoacetyl-CoA reductase
LELCQIEQRVAIVTGGTRGIGAAITTALVRSGVYVAAGYGRNQSAAEDLAGKLTAEGASVSVHRGNVGDPEDCQHVVSEVLAATGRIDYLVNNAGITLDKTMRKMTVEDWHTVLRINLSGTFYMCKAVLEPMLERQFGRIVNISSVVGQKGNVGQVNYAASKSGLFGLTRSLALEVARKGITVNCSRPAVSRPRWPRPSRRTSPRRSWPESRWAGSARRPKSPAPCSSSSTTTPATSPARSSPSTAAWTCST